MENANLETSAIFSSLNFSFFIAFLIRFQAFSNGEKSECEFSGIQTVLSVFSLFSDSSRVDWDFLILRSRSLARSFATFLKIWRNFILGSSKVYDVFFIFSLIQNYIIINEESRIERQRSERYNDISSNSKIFSRRSFSKFSKFSMWTDERQRAWLFEIPNKIVNETKSCITQFFKNDKKWILFFASSSWLNVENQCITKGCHYSGKCHYLRCHYYEWAQYF